LPASVAIDPEHWRKRAEEARDLADRMSDPLAKELMLWPAPLRIAKDYELLAEREPKNGKIWPQNTKEVTRYASRGRSGAEDERAWSLHQPILEARTPHV
jgi:hypothetical protein